MFNCDDKARPVCIPTAAFLHVNAGYSFFCSPPTRTTPPRKRLVFYPPESSGCFAPVSAGPRSVRCRSEDMMRAPRSAFCEKIRCGHDHEAKELVIRIMGTRCDRKCFVRCLFVCAVRRRMSKISPSFPLHATDHLTAFR